MDFTLTSEQRLIVETVRSFVEDELYPHEDEVERLDEIPDDLASSIRGRPSRPACTPRTCPPSSAAAGWTRCRWCSWNANSGAPATACRCWSNGPATSCWPARATSGRGIC